MNQILRKTLLLLFGGVFMSTAAWADDIVVPTPVYFNDFSSATGLTIVGNGAFETDVDARFGKIYHNNTEASTAARTNYLQLPDDVLSHSATSKQMTIGFWVNVKNATAMTNEPKFYFSPIFSAYALTPAENTAASHAGNEDNFPMFVCQTRGLLQLNNGGWCNFEKDYNDDNVKKTNGNTESTAWIDGGAWHYYTIVLTATTAKIYIDGVILNSWTVDGTSDGQKIEGFFTYGGNYKCICLGGNQAWNWGDPDPAFGFDDFAVYDEALTQAQIKQIMTNKLVQGTAIGELDYTTGYLAASSTPRKLYPGDSFRYRYINYYNGGNAWLNWLLMVKDPTDANKFVLRTDWYDDINGSELAEHQRGFSTNVVDYNANVPSKMNGATVDMKLTFTADKKFLMESTVTALDETTWTYNYTSVNDNNVDLTSFDYIQVALSVNASWLDVLSEGYSAIGAAIGATGWGTFASDYILNFDGISGLTANVVSDYNTSTKSITVTPVTEVPAATPLLLNGNEGVYSVPVLASTSASIGTNYLVRGPGDEVGEATGTNTRFVLVVSGTNAVFKKIGDTKHPVISKEKAYLEIPAVLSARELSINLDGGDATAIKTMKVGTEDNIYYNLQGQRVLYPTKGLYIVNGKKVIIK